MKSIDRKAYEANHLIRNGRADLARPLLDQLLASDDRRADFLLATLHWYGGYKVPIDEPLAIAHYRRSMDRHPAALTAVHFGLALLYQGNREEGFEWLQFAAKHGNPPETEIALAKFWEAANPPDLAAARRYFRRAYLRGRIAGLYHLVRIRREQGQFWRCLGIGLFCLPLTLLFHLVLGRKARMSI